MSSDVRGDVLLPSSDVLEYPPQLGDFDGPAVVGVIRVEERVHLVRGKQRNQARRAGCVLSIEFVEGTVRGAVRLQGGAARACLGDGSRGSELFDATEELLLRDSAVAICVPFPKEVVQPVALLIQHAVPFLHRVDVAPLCIEPLLCQEAEVHEKLLK